MLHCCGLGAGQQLQLQFDPQPQELPYATGVVLKKKKKDNSTAVAQVTVEVQVQSLAWLSGSSITIAVAQVAVEAAIQSLAWELPYVADVAINKDIKTLKQTQNMTSSSRVGILILLHNIHKEHNFAVNKSSLKDIINTNTDLLYSTGNYTQNYITK